jgi:outer membrane scaffolding protein for murein synthesis (MipA/OmpV family)
MTPNQMRKTLFKSAVLLSFGLVIFPAWAELKPQWELGVGVAGIDFPVYRGAEGRKSYLLPVPYVQYHGDVVKVDRDRMRGLLFRRDLVEMDVSVNGSVPVKSNDTAERYGMPDIDPILEIGPSVNVHLYFDDKRHTNLDLRLPVRAAISSDFSSVSFRGWLFQPSLNLDFRNMQQSGWNLGFVAGLLYADQRYHQYFYDVAPQYATPTRPAYSAGGGYSGAQFTVALSKRFPGHWVGGFMKWDDLEGAAFMGSPLVTRGKAFSVGFAVSWILSTSDKMVEVSDD